MASAFDRDADRIESTCARAWRPFPLDDLPEDMRAYAVSVAAALNIDPAPVALQALGVLAGIIGNARALQVRTGWIEPAAIWAVHVADSGAAKSPALARLTKPAHDLDYEERERYRFQMDAHSESPNTDQPEPPRRLIVQDTTSASLVEIAAENPAGLLLEFDEMSGVLRTLADPRNHRDEAILLASYDGRPYAQDRVKTDTNGRRTQRAVPRLLVSIVGNLTSGNVIKDLRGHHWLDGFAARISWCLPPRPEFVSLKSRPDLSEQAASKWRRTLHHVASLTLQRESLAGGGHRMSPGIVVADHDAREALLDYADECQLAAREYEGFAGSSASKSAGLAGRVALCLHCAEVSPPGAFGVTKPAGARDPGQDPHCRLGSRTAERAVRIAAWIRQEALRVYERFHGNRPVLPHDEAALLRFLESRGAGPVEGREVANKAMRHHEIKGAVTRTNVAKQAAQKLEARGLVHITRRVSPNNGKVAWWVELRKAD